MRKSRLLPFVFLLAPASAITLACGSPMSPVTPSCGTSATATNSGVPASITLCPATADAKDYPNGQVQFVATGYYATPPSPVTPLKAEIWGACQQQSSTTEVSITGTGLAQCAAGSSGTYNVYASDSTECNAITACGGGCQVSGYAQLTCP
jgi:hypothetical protein